MGGTAWQPGKQLVKYHHFQCHHHYCHHRHLHHHHYHHLHHHHHQHYQPLHHHHHHHYHHHHHIHHPKPGLIIIQEHVCKFGNKPSYESCGLWTTLLHGSMSSNCVLISLPDVANGLWLCWLGADMALQLKLSKTQLSW